ncbi:MAG: PQQ-like beta-propeller repeat protein [Gemmataceae bacterium]|nr:PQQ-like beta-propeller repeat protein [Gemmataceae bacterium]MCI0737533.1 PQQ-like beta-propeller repeat protein [Gemmataceae bacterium]
MLSVIVLSVFSFFALAADWTHWRGPWQTGVSPETGLPDKFSPDPADPDNNLVWKAPYGCRSTSLILNGRVYIINNVGRAVTEQERVMCFDADTGKVLWEYKFNVWHTDIVSSRLGWTNLAADPKTGNIYAHGTQGLLLCFNKDGKVLWQRSLTEEFGRVSGYGGRIVSPIVDGDLVLLSMNNSSWGDQAKGSTRFLALDKDTGTVVWWAEPVGPPKDSYYSTPVTAVIAGRKQLIGGCGEGTLVGLDYATGQTLWRYPLGTAMINCSPVVGDNLVFAAHGEENYDNNLRGRVVCLDAAALDAGKPKEIWKVDGIKARYASPILDMKAGRLYVPEDSARLFCLDVKTGARLWNFTYGRNGRGSPLLADGKIYVGEVFSRFTILQPGPKNCKLLHEHEFLGNNPKEDVEINGTPAAANGRVYFATSEELYCIGLKGAKSATAPSVTETLAKGTKIEHIALYPAEVTLHPGDSISFEVRAFDGFGNRMKVEGGAEWQLPAPTPPPGAKTAPPPLKGVIKDGKLVVDDKTPNQGGYVVAKTGGFTAKARVRVAPRYPYEQNFDKLPDGAVPGGWVNTQGKFLVKTLEDGNKVLAKVNTNSSPLIARGVGFIGQPADHDYTIQADVQGGLAGDDLPEVGIVANRYTLLLAGNIQKLRIVSWDALPRLDRTAAFSWQKDQWYTMKLTVESKGSEAVVKGKCWKKGDAEPVNWTITATDPRPNTEGAPGLYGYVTGILETGVGTPVYFDNVRITPNK